MSSHKDLRPAQMQNSEYDVKRVTKAISGFTNPFSSNVDDNVLFVIGVFLLSLKSHIIFSVQLSLDRSLWKTSSNHGELIRLIV